MRGIPAIVGMLLVGGVVATGKSEPVPGGQGSSVARQTTVEGRQITTMAFGMPRRAKPGACLHGTDETAEERTRRSEALAYVRSINNAQGRFSAANKRYGQFNELTGLGGVPFEFVLLHAAASNNYVFSLKHEADPCGYTLYSDRGGIIYVASPMQ
jgi:hypothetical protein